MTPPNHSKKNLLLIVYAVVMLFMIAMIIRRIPKYFDEVAHKQDSTSTNSVSLFASPSPTSTPTPTPFKNPSAEAQKWYIAAGGVLAYRNQDGFDTLASKLPRDQVEILLGDSWGVYDRRTALSTLQWLKTEGHSADFEQLRLHLLDETGGDESQYPQVKKEILSLYSSQDQYQKSFLIDFVWQHRDDLAEKKLKAWDYMRMINVARWSYTLGYITQEEAWKYIVYGGDEMKKSYASWDELGEHYIIGRIFWSNSPNQPETKYAVVWLETSPISPWKKIPWNMDLHK